MQPTFDINTPLKKATALSQEEFVNELEYFNSSFQHAEEMWQLRSVIPSKEYLEGLHGLINKIKDFRLSKGFKRNGELSALKNFPSDFEELDLCKMSLKAYHKKIWFLYRYSSLDVRIVNDRGIYDEKFQKVSEKILYQNSYDRTTYDDVALFYAYTLFQILEKLGVQTLKEKAVDNRSTAGNFELMYQMSTKDTYNSLLNNKFIDDSTNPKMFDQIFRKGELVNKINWIGKSYELARFVFFLHTNIPEKNHTAVCLEAELKYLKTAYYFTINGATVDPIKLANSNRSYNEERDKLLLTAISHLKKREINTSMK